MGVSPVCVVNVVIVNKDEGSESRPCTKACATRKSGIGDILDFVRPVFPCFLSPHFLRNLVVTDFLNCNILQWMSYLMKLRIAMNFMAMKVKVLKFDKL